MNKGFVQYVHFSYLSLSLFFPSVGFLSYTEQSTDLCRCRPTFRQCKIMVLPTSVFTERHPPCPDPKLIPRTASERRKPATTARHPRRNVLVPFRVCIASDVGVPNLVFGSSGSHHPPWIIPPALPLMEIRALCQAETYSISYHPPSALPRE
jgi:hypothetical protein